MTIETRTSRRLKPRAERDWARVFMGRSSEAAARAVEPAAGDAAEAGALGQLLAGGTGRRVDVDDVDVAVADRLAFHDQGAVDVGVAGEGQRRVLGVAADEKHAVDQR